MCASKNPVYDQPRLVYTTVPDGVLEPLVDPACPYAGLPPTTIIDRFSLAVEKWGSRPAMALKRAPRGSSHAVESLPWTTWTWRAYHEECRQFAKSLLHLRCAAYSVVNCIGFNSPEWFIANNGAIMAACISAGIYTSNLPAACQYISSHSKAQVVVCEGNEQLKKYAEIGASLPHLKCIVVWAEEPDAQLARECGVAVYSWAQFLRLGADGGVTDAQLDSRQRVVRPGSCSTLIYTSGTTGQPKAVMISHDNVTWTTAALADNYLHLDCDDRILSYLPLSHIAAQMIDVHVPMYIGGCTHFAQPDCMKGSLTTSMKDVQPTFFFGVPRVWEKIQEKLAAIGRETTGLKKAIGAWAKAQALDKAQRAQFGAQGGQPACYGCANAVVLSKIHQALGLGACKACFTGAAPISADTLWYFSSLGLPIYEVFGQSECSGPQTVSCAGNWKVGSAGRPMVGTESKVCEGGEIAYRGRHIMMGYMYMEEQTKAAIDSDGFLHSGDVATFDDDNDSRIKAGPGGFMQITGRIKELIITAGGENIPPVLIEAEMKQAMLALSNVMVVGDRRKFLTSLVSFKTTVDLATGMPTNQLAADALFEGRIIGSNATTVEQAAQDPLWKAYVAAGLAVANGKTTSSAQVVQKWAILPRDFSEAEGTLTPTLKLKRAVAAERYAGLIEKMYA